MRRTSHISKNRLNKEKCKSDKMYIRMISQIHVLIKLILVLVHTRDLDNKHN